VSIGAEDVPKKLELESVSSMLSRARDRPSSPQHSMVANIGIELEARYCEHARHRLAGVERHRCRSAT
jgi:hypothetical protein